MSKINATEVEINGVAYVQKDSIKSQSLAQNADGLPFVIIRTHVAGCHAGYLKSDDNGTVELLNSRRLWRWRGANTLSELAMQGPTNPGECKFGCVLPLIKIYNVAECITTSVEAKTVIEGVQEWK
jgi:hypothetical protein